MNLTTAAQYYTHPVMDARDYGWGAGSVLLSFVFFVVIIMAVIYIVRGHGYSHHHQESPAQTPLDIAKKRYAGGEITKAEFEQIKKDIA